MNRLGFGSGWAWGIGLVAILISVWAVLDFVDAVREEAVRGAGAPLAAEAPRSPRDAIELHRLLPDATDDLGTLVRVDGTVAAVIGDGFWLRDLRDNVVFIVDPRASRRRRDAELKAGSAVTVVGVIGLIPPGDAPVLDVAELPVPPSAVVVRDIRIEPIPRGVAVLGR
ncbi:MAG TPA: hypothetical protein VF192_07895 [Longimicrobiales bacterium]